MILLDKKGIDFFRAELTKETERQIKMFEGNAPTEIMEREIGRVRLYEEKARIGKHFMVTEPSIGGFERNHPHHGLLGKVIGMGASAALIWLEIEGMRHSIKGSIEPTLVWEQEKLPKARLTNTGKFQKKQEYENMATRG